jgi:ParB-like chromosome segregation protein Spo0J
MPELPSPIHTEKPPDWFRSEPVDESTEEFKNLVDSVFKYGVLEPPICTEDGEVIAGRHRVAAARKATLKMIAAMIYPKSLTVTQRRLVTITENLQRREMPDHKTYGLVKELEELNPGWSKQDLASHLSKSPATITRYFAPDGLEPEPLAAFMAGEFGFAKAYELSRSKDQLAALAALRGGQTRDQMAATRRKSASKPAVRSSKIKCPLPGGLVVSVSGGEVSLEEAIEAFGDAAKLTRKALGMGYSAQTAQRAWKDVAAAGG